VHPEAVVAVEYRETIHQVLVPAIRNFQEFYVIGTNNTITCMIFAGATFNLIHESQMICVSHNFGTIHALPLFTR